MIPKNPPISGIGNGALFGGGAVALSISGAVRFADGAFALLRGLASGSGGASVLLRGLASGSGGAFATHVSFSACWPRGQSKGQSAW
jgi:hypothetical protein